MNEKNPQFNRPEPLVVGPASLETKKEKARQIVERFGERHYEQLTEKQRIILKSVEYKKKKCEKLAIEKVNEITNSILSNFGLPPFNIPERNIHLVPEKLFKEIISRETGELVGITFQDKQAILLNAELLVHPINRISAILHEMIHLKNYLAIEANGKSEKVYRNGLKISALGKKAEKIGGFITFMGLNEAIVTEIEKRYLNLCLSEVVNDLKKSSKLGYYDRNLIEEYQRQSLERIQDFKKIIADLKAKQEDEIIWVSKDGENFVSFPYYEQRKVLNYIVNVLYEDNQDKFKSPEDVMKLFFKAHFDGKLLSIARFITKSFGDDAFEVIGMMTDYDANSAHLVMNYLVKHRKRIK